MAGEFFASSIFPGWENAGVPGEAMVSPAGPHPGL